MRKNRLMKWVTGFAVAGVLLAGITGLTQSTAMAKEDKGVGTVKVETVKTYEKETKTKNAKIVVPQIKTEKKSTGAEKINKEIKKYTDKLIKDFKKDLKNDGYRSVLVSYKVMTDNKDMFTLRLGTEETIASNSVSYRYYHLDKKTGKVMTIKDLFKKNANYKTVINKELKKQMTKEMNEEFKSIKQNQKFYVDKKGNVVICFNEYEIASGAEGCLEFTIAQSKLAKILK